MWAVAPVKDLTDAKQRLGGLLSASERRGLFRSMLRDVLATLVETRGLAGVLVVTRDPEAVALAEKHGMRVLLEEANEGQSRAVSRAAERLATEKADGLVAVPGDVPLVTARELEQLLEAHARAAPAMTIVPDRHGTGTNCIACSPPDLMPFRFGPDSFPRHLSAARAMGVEARVLRLPGLGLDVDTPRDLQAFLDLSAATHTHAFLEQHAIGERIRALRTTAVQSAGGDGS